MIIQIRERSDLLLLKNVYPEFATGSGVFNRFISPPWGTDIQGLILDIIFFYEFGERYVSNLVLNFTQNGVITSVGLSNIPKFILESFKEPWTRKYNLLKQQYNPIQNYDMTENTTNSLSRTTRNEVTGSHNNTVNLSDKNTGTVTAETSNNIYGFNSSTGKPSDDATGTNTTDMTNLRTGTDNLAISDIDSGTLSDSGTTTLTRSGNIGVTTSQQMIQSEIDLWEWNYYRSVMLDVSKILTLSTY